MLRLLLHLMRSASSQPLPLSDSGCVCAKEK